MSRSVVQVKMFCEINCSCCDCVNNRAGNLTAGSYGRRRTNFFSLGNNHRLYRPKVPNFQQQNDAEPSNCCLEPLVEARSINFPQNYARAQNLASSSKSLLKNENPSENRGTPQFYHLTNGFFQSAEPLNLSVNYQIQEEPLDLTSRVVGNQNLMDSLDANYQEPKTLQQQQPLITASEPVQEGNVLLLGFGLDTTTGFSENNDVEVMGDELLNEINQHENRDAEMRNETLENLMKSFKYVEFHLLKDTRQFKNNLTKHTSEARIKTINPGDFEGVCDEIAQFVQTGKLEEKKIF